MLKKVAFVALAGLTVASTGALAGTASDTMTVTATITASCSITANDLNFGSLTSTNTGPTDVATSVDVTCTSDSPFNVGIDYGVNALNSPRRMASGGNFLTYDVYKDDGLGNCQYVTPYGPASTYNTANNYNSPLTGNSGTTNIPICGRILQQSTPASGSYSDTLTVSVNY